MAAPCRLRTPNPIEKLTHLAAASRDYHLSLHRIQGEERFHLALDERGRVMDVSRTAQRRTGLVRASTLHRSASFCSRGQIRQLISQGTFRLLRNRRRARFQLRYLYLTTRMS